MSSLETVVSICNKALVNIGAAQISDIAENTKSAIKCNTFYEYCRDTVLADHPWNFAKERVVLTADATAPEFGYDYRFVLPEDYLMSVQIVDSDDENVEVSREGNYLLCDTDVIYLVYIKRVTDTSLFSQGFVKSLILLLSAHLAFDITGSSTKFDQMMKMYMLSLPDAKKSNSVENQKKAVRITTWIDQRR